MKTIASKRVEDLSPEQKRQLLARLLKKPVKRDRFPLSYAQERLWFMDQLQPGTAMENLPSAFHMRGVLKEQVLERVFNEIIRRHEVLRTTFEMSPTGPVQIVHDHGWRELPMVDLVGLEEKD